MNINNYKSITYIHLILLIPFSSLYTPKNWITIFEVGNGHNLEGVFTLNIFYLVRTLSSNLCPTLNAR